MTDAENFVLAGFVAGFRWVPPAKKWATGLPRAIPTVSDCLTDFLPAGPDIEAWQRPLFEPWQRSFADAAAAAGHAPPSPGTAHVLSMSVTAAQGTVLTALIEGWLGDLPHPIRLNLTRPAAAPPGAVLGFEVLGFDTGRFHSWLCHRHDTTAYDELGIRPGKSGMLTTFSDAEHVVDLLSTDQDDTTWFPALIAEHDIDRGAVETST
ncbi:hypothetical protein [Winogradskya humida]|uniref:Uncharacterized protein n=1 Tax=Winogradskya humida TaxID=113566 RepID=A0ABQ3ZHD5_9ACTN|nr:hypothetical protein [Actinoplanes humidus]GIE18004.1 hypothetical protein Ahu01nite_011060 [Actinoplanes humidus]